MKKILKRTTAWLMVMFVMLSGSTVVYADTYHDFRDTEIELVLPDSWKCDEVDKFTSEDASYEWIAEAYEDIDDDSELWMNLYYMHDFIGGTDAYYITDTDDGQEYYERYGKAAIETLYTELDWGESVDIGEMSLYDGEYGAQLVVPIEGDYDDGTVFHHTIYLDCETNYETNKDGERAVVHMIKMFYRNDDKPLDEEDIEIAEAIANDCYDYGYYENGYFGKADGIGSEIFDLILTVLPFLIVIPGIIAAGIKKLPDLLGNERVRPKKKKPILMSDKKKSFGRKEGKRDSEEIKRLERKPVASNGPRKAMSSEERYMESLRTLRKSGLLTREEMVDMLERHEKNKAIKGVNRERRKR